MSFLEILDQLYYASRPGDAARELENHKYQAKLAEMEYISMRRGYLPVLRDLRFAPSDFAFSFKDNSKRILSKEQRQKDRRKITRYLANLRSGMFSELKAIKTIKNSRNLIENFTGAMCDSIGS